MQSGLFVLVQAVTVCLTCCFTWCCAAFTSRGGLADNRDHMVGRGDLARLLPSQEGASLTPAAGQAPGSPLIAATGAHPLLSKISSVLPKVPYILLGAVQSLRC